MKGYIKAFVSLEVLAVLSLHVYFNFLKHSSNDFINTTTAFAVVPPQEVIEERAVLPIIDITELLKIKQSDDIIKLKNNLVINQIGHACRHFGFFYITSSLFNTSLYHELDHNSHKFFDHVSAEDKDKIHMRHNGKAWRGYFAVGDEFTSGLADNKEGIYFGKQDETNSSELLHGYNVYPKFMHNNQSYDMKLLIDNYMNEMESIGHALIQAIIVSLNLNIEEEQLSEYFSFQDPTILFRIFNYPPHSNDDNRIKDSYGVGAHTDYGYLTILRQESDGLQIKLSSSRSEDGWINVPVVPNTFVINLGDALERQTGGLLRATLHRVQKRVNSTMNRLSFPYFFDPNFYSEMKPVFNFLNDDDKNLAVKNREKINRWDKQDPSDFVGTYGRYLINKVTKVFPDLAKSNLNNEL